MVATSKTPKKRPRGIVVNITFDPEALMILKRFCPPGKRMTGRLLGRLLFEHQARQEERARLQGTLSAALDGVSIITEENGKS